MSDDTTTKKIESLSEDERLFRIFNSKDISCISLWILNLKIEDKDCYCLLYGFVIPSTVSPEAEDVIDEWYSKDCKKCTGSEGIKFSVTKLTYYNKGTEILNLILEMLKELELGDSCKNIGLATPKKCEELTINSTEKGYAVRPVVFLESKESLKFFETPKPLMSPLVNAPSFMGSLFLRDKSKILPDKIKENDELIKMCMSCLKKETGLNFDGSDSPRLGNIEFISYPSSNDYEVAKVLFKTIKEEPKVPEGGLRGVTVENTAPEVEVKIFNDGSLDKTEILVRCRIRNGGEITLDQCKELNFNNESDL